MSSSAEFQALQQRLKAYEQVYQFGAAIQLCHQGLREWGQSYELANHLGRYLLLQGKVPEALQVFQRLLRQHPDDYMLESNLLFYRHYSGIESGEGLLAAHQAWSRKWASGITRFPERKPSSPLPTEKIRIGWVSPDFRRHPVASFLEPLLLAIDRRRFSLYGYGRNLKSDAVTDRLRPLFNEWREFDESTLAATALKIREDQIDVLVDLAGHTPGQSLLLFAARPAPIQVTYLGYPNTTGLPGMDYRLVDPYSDPVGESEHFHTEQLIRLPDSAWCYQPAVEATKFLEEPAKQRQGFITFGSFNALCKISDDCLRWWARILEQVPGSRLLVKNYALHDLEGRQSFQRRALSLGFPVDRLDLLGGLPAYLHHQSYRMVDILLDTYPYHGTTTTCEAFWMGVPVVTLAGKFHVSRVGASLLHQVGLDELVSHSPEEYIALAVKLAENAVHLRDLHHELQRRMARSPLTNAPLLARHFERAVEQMVENWHKGCPQPE